MCGSQTYQLLNNLLALGKLAEKTYGERVQVLNVYYQPKLAIIVENFLEESLSDMLHER